MDQVNVAVRHLVYSFLDQHTSSLQDIKWKDLRSFIEAKLLLPANACKTEPYRSLIQNYITGYLDVRNNSEDIKVIKSVTADISRDSQGNEAELVDREKFVKGRFTNNEAKKVKEAIEEFCRLEGVTPQDLVGFYQDDSKPLVKAKVWVTFIRERLPHRDGNAIKRHVLRTILRTDLTTAAFSDKEKDDLLDLVKLHGKKFVEIGRIMNKVPDDCQQMYLRLQRKKEGAFTAEEDAKIVRAVLAHLRLPEITPVLPNTQISWTNITDRLDKERTSLDYQRRYGVLLSLNQQQNYQPHLQLEVVSQSAEKPKKARLSVSGEGLLICRKNQVRKSRSDNDKLTKKYFLLLQHLKQLDAEDESEVRWSVVDKALGEMHSIDAWYLLRKECPTNDEEVVTFNEKLEYLYSKYEKKISEASLVDQSTFDTTHSDGDANTMSNLSRLSGIESLSQKAVEEATEVLVARGISSPLHGQSKKKRRKGKTIVVDLLDKSDDEEDEEEEDHDQDKGEKREEVGEVEVEGGEVGGDKEGGELHFTEEDIRVVKPSSSLTAPKYKPSDIMMVATSSVVPNIISTSSYTTPPATPAEQESPILPQSSPLPSTLSASTPLYRTKTEEGKGEKKRKPEQVQEQEEEEEEEDEAAHFEEEVEEGNEKEGEGSGLMDIDIGAEMERDKAREGKRKKRKRGSEVGGDKRGRDPDESWEDESLLNMRANREVQEEMGEAVAEGEGVHKKHKKSKKEKKEKRERKREKEERRKSSQSQTHEQEQT